MSTYLITGATGLVGSSLIPILRDRGHQLLYLVRETEKESAETRLKNIIGPLTDRDVVVPGDITLELGGFTQDLLRNWNGKVDKIIHSAASVKFDASLAEETRTINIGGTKAMLNLASTLGIPEFHYVSTAYVAGDAATFTEADFDIGQRARNVYEASKFESEQNVRNWSGRFTIYRPSIVVGDGTNGFIQSFNGIYGFLAPFWRSFQALHDRWQRQSDACEKEGIIFGRDGLLQLPLIMKCSPTSTVNIVTCDWISKMISELIELPSSNDTFHLVNPTSPTARWTIETSLRLLGICGLQFDTALSLTGRAIHKLRMHKVLQAGIDRSLNRFMPYMTHEPVFRGENVKKVLKDLYHPPPVVDEMFLRRLLEYAKSVNFGQRVKILGFAS